MLKVTYTDVNIAARTLVEGLAIHYFHINPSYTEAERFQHITQCYSCYSYMHITKDCPTKDKKFCSTCGNEGHDFKACTTTMFSPLPGIEIQTLSM